MADAGLDVEIDEIGVVDDDGLDRPARAVPFLAVGGDDVDDFPGEAVFEGEGRARDGVTEEPAFAVLLGAVRAAGVLEELPDVVEDRPGQEDVGVDLEPAAVGRVQDFADLDGRLGDGPGVLDEEGEGHLAKVGRHPAAPLDGLGPGRQDEVAQADVGDGVDFGEQVENRLSHGSFRSGGPS